jgi:hypothetical protein
MSSPRFLLAASVALLPMSAAEPGKPAEPEKPDVVMPVMKVPATRIQRFGLYHSRFNGADKLVVWHVPTKSDMFMMLIGGADVGDEIVSIDGQDVATIPRHKRQEMLRGHFKIVVKRPVGRRSFNLLELDGRGD